MSKVKIKRLNLISSIDLNYYLREDVVKTSIQHNILSRILQVKNKLIRYLKSLLITDSIAH